jgi:streptogramin lyase
MRMELAGVQVSMAPVGVATDSTGNVYVADYGNDTIRKVASNGEVTTLAGMAGVAGNTDGIGANASFSLPYGIATDGAGNVFVAEMSSHTIRKITPAGVVTTLAGNAGVAGYTDGIGADASFSSPHGVATDKAGNVYVADYGNDTVRKITPLGR